MDEDHRRAVPARSGSEDTAAAAVVSPEDLERIQRYLVGELEAYQELERWIRIELKSKYPRFSDEFEDLCQIVHGKLLVGLGSGRFEGRATLRSYLCGIVHRTALDRLRRFYRDRTLSEALSVERDSGTDNPYDRIEARDEIRRAHRVVTSSSESCRELWRMVFVEKLDYEEIGRRLAIPPGTVKSRMWHCRSKARKALRRLAMLDRVSARSAEQNR